MSGKDEEAAVTTPTHTPHRGAKPPTEEEIVTTFLREGLSPHSWSNAPGDRYAPHFHPYHKLLYCVRGSIRFLVGTDSEQMSLAPGDRLEIPPGVLHSAVVGQGGVTCMEAQKG